MSVLLCEVFKKIISSLGGGSNYGWLAGELFAGCHQPRERVPNGGLAARAHGSGNGTQSGAALMVSGGQRRGEEGRLAVSRGEGL